MPKTFVTPTERWNTETVNVPDHGSVRRSYPFRNGEKIPVPEPVAQYLIRKYLAKSTEPPEDYEEPAAADPPERQILAEVAPQTEPARPVPEPDLSGEGNQPEESVVEIEAGPVDSPPPQAEPPPEPPPEPTDSTFADSPPAASEDPNDPLVAFFEKATKEQMEAIQYIGAATADEIIEARPLTWEALDEILSDRQIDAAWNHLQ